MKLASKILENKTEQTNESKISSEVKSLMNTIKAMSSTKDDDQIRAYIDTMLVDMSFILRNVKDTKNMNILRDMRDKMDLPMEK